MEELVIKKAKTGGWYCNYKGNRILVKEVVSLCCSVKYASTIYSKNHYPWHGVLGDNVLDVVRSIVDVIDDN